ncbi:MAG: DUF4843 domain-containing protein [Sphingobacterium sp.]|jgi:hypothetical protein|nr:DUF4843 domain-containing protein [Sphingobacterium sp.]
MSYDSKDAIFFVNRSLLYTFYGMSDESNVDTIAIPLQLLGRLADHDRTINVVVDSTLFAVEGKDFEILPIVLPKDSSTTMMKILVHRNEQMRDDTFITWLRLVDSEDINAAKLSREQFELSFSDKIEKPDWWDDAFQYQPFTVLRMQFYLEAIGSMENPKGPNNENNLEKLAYVKFRLNLALAEYFKEHGVHFVDENGDTVSWGQ